MNCEKVQSAYCHIELNQIYLKNKPFPIFCKKFGQFFSKFLRTSTTVVAISIFNYKNRTASSYFRHATLPVSSVSSSPLPTPPPCSGGGLRILQESWGQVIFPTGPMQYLSFSTSISSSFSVVFLSLILKIRSHDLWSAYIFNFYWCLPPVVFMFTP